MKFMLCVFFLFACYSCFCEEILFKKHQMLLTEKGILVNFNEGIILADSVLYVGDGNYVISKDYIPVFPRKLPAYEKYLKDHCEDKNTK